MFENDICDTKLNQMSKNDTNTEIFKFFSVFGQTKCHSLIDVDKKRASFTIYLCDEKRSISKCLNLLHFKWVKYSLVFGPGDELKGRMGLDVTVNDAAQMKGKVLNGWSVHNATWI